MALTCFVFGMLNEPRIGLILAAGLPVTGYCISQAKDARLQALHVQQWAYTKAGGAAGSALSMAKVVAAFNGQHQEVKRYEDLAAVAEAQGVRAGAALGLAWGAARVANLCTVAVAFYAASFFIISGYQSGCWHGGPTRDTCISGGMVLVAEQLIMRCSAATLSSLPESISEIAAAQVAAARRGRRAGPHS